MAEPELFVRRLELRLARRASEPLRELPLDPDALGVFARQFARVNVDPRHAESAEVLIDLLPVSGPRARRMRKRIARRVGKPDLGIRGGGKGSGGFFAQVMDDAGLPGSGWGGANGSGARKPSPGEVVGHRVETQQLTTKVAGADEMFELQVLIRVTSLDEGRADMLIKGMLSAFRIFKGHNEFRVTGISLGGAAFLGADVWWRRRWFDYRAVSGYWRPKNVWGGNGVNLGEVGLFLRPPTTHCAERNVIRSGPYLSPAPTTLPVYRRQPGVLPLGRVWRNGREVMAGKPLYSYELDADGKRTRRDEFFFGGVFGRARQGKTELVLNWLLHVAHCEPSGLFMLDPAIDANERVLPYLTGPGVRERVVQLDLSRRGELKTHVGWNPMSMVGLTAEHVGPKARAIADAFAAAAGWSSKSTPRTSAILDNALSSLLTLGLVLPKSLQPTIFTIPRLLTDEMFRNAVIMRLPRHLAQFWTRTYVNYGPDASGPISQLISRLQTIPTVRATLGASESTYDPRRAMDDGLIVLASPSSVTDHLVSALMLSAHIDAARSRTDIADPELRRLFYMFFDEAQTFDTESPQGSMLAAFLEQLGKFGVRVVPMAQSPHRLKDSTLEAITTNASTIATTATSPRAAKFFQDQWGADGDVDAKRAVMRLPRFRYVMQVTHQGRRVDPFRVDGVPLEVAWGDHRHPESLDVLQQVIDAHCRPRMVRDTLALIEHHDDKILHYLINGGGTDPRAGGGPGPAGGGGGGVRPKPRGPAPSPEDDAELDDLGPDGWNVKTPPRPNR